MVAAISRSVIIRNLLSTIKIKYTLNVLFNAHLGYIFHENNYKPKHIQLFNDAVKRIDLIYNYFT